MSFDLFNEVATDPKKETEGVWEDYNDQASFLIARAGTAKYNATVVRLFEKNKVVLKGRGEAASKKSDAVMAEVMAEHILLGWKGDFNWQGKPVGPYNKETAISLLSVKDFREWVDGVSKDQARFRFDAADEAEEKN